MWIGIVIYFGVVVFIGMVLICVKVGFGWVGIGCEFIGWCDRFCEKV